jgi:hypothetical protein
MSSSTEVELLKKELEMLRKSYVNSMVENMSLSCQLEFNKIKDTENNVEEKVVRLEHRKTDKSRKRERSPEVHRTKRSRSYDSEHEGREIKNYKETCYKYKVTVDKNQVKSIMGPCYRCSKRAFVSLISDSNLVRKFRQEFKEKIISNDIGTEFKSRIGIQCGHCRFN